MHYPGFNKIAWPLTSILKELINQIIRKHDLIVSVVKNNEVESGSNDNKANKTNKNLAKSKNIKKLLKNKKFAKTRRLE